MASKNGNRRATAPQREARTELIERIRSEERKRIEKAMEIAIKVYGPAFRELEKL